MKLKYLGPRDSIMIQGNGLHEKGEIKEYPDDVGQDLLATSVKQKFEAVDDSVLSKTGKDLPDMTVPELKKLCDELHISYTADAKKADLVALIRGNTAEPQEE